MDIRPKRRRKKDNPYNIEKDSKQNKYLVTFKDSRNQKIIIQISSELFYLFNEFELDHLSELNEYDNHIEHSELVENNLYKRAIHKDESIEDIIIRKFENIELYNAIIQLPEIQQRRIFMYYFSNLTLEQIAKIEKCSKVAIKYSIDIAIKNLKIILKNKI